MGKWLIHKRKDSVNPLRFSHELKGRLSNSDGNENVTIKVKSRCFELYALIPLL